MHFSDFQFICKIERMRLVRLAIRPYLEQAGDNIIFIRLKNIYTHISMSHTSYRRFQLLILSKASFAFSTCIIKGAK